MEIKNCLKYGGGGSGKGLEKRKFPITYSDNFYEN